MLKANNKSKWVYAVLAALLFAVAGASGVYAVSLTEMAFSQAERPLKASDIAFTPGANESERNFNWHTAATDMAGVVVLSKLDANGAVVVTNTYTASVSQTAGGESSHKATVTGLTENTTYSYRFGDGNGAWSKSYTFETQDDETYNFIFLGDPQIGAGNDTKETVAAWAHTLSTATKIFPDTAFLISAGDQVNEATSESQYDGWFAPGELTAYATAVTIGSHDDAAVFSEHFNVPNATGLGATSAGSDYYYTYGNTLFMFLNTESKDIAEHKEAMETAIAAKPDFRHKVVVMHQSIYSAADHATDSSVLFFRANLVPIFDDLGIDIVLMGHDHVYVRTYQMKGDKAVEGVVYNADGAAVDPEGTLYITGNSSSGSKYYTMQEPSVFDDYAIVAMQLEEPTYLNVEVTDASMTFKTYKVSDASVVDTYSIVKTAESDSIIEESNKDQEKAATEDTVSAPESRKKMMEWLPVAGVLFVIGGLYFFLRYKHPTK